MATRWLALRLCVDGRDPAELPAGLPPARCSTAAVSPSGDEVGQGYTLFDHLARGAPKTLHPLRAADFQRLAKAGRLVWLFDGIMRSRIRICGAMFLDILLSVSQSLGRGILTCRLVGSDIIRDRVARHDIACVTLLDFDDDQSTAFSPAGTNWRSHASASAARSGASGCAMRSTRT